MPKLLIFDSFRPSLVFARLFANNSQMAKNNHFQIVQFTMRSGLFGAVPWVGVESRLHTEETARSLDVTRNSEPHSQTRVSFCMMTAPNSHHLRHLVRRVPRCGSCQRHDKVTIVDSYDTTSGDVKTEMRVSRSSCESGVLSSLWCWCLLNSEMFFVTWPTPPACIHIHSPCFTTTVLPVFFWNRHCRHFNPLTFKQNAQFVCFL